MSDYLAEQKASPPFLQRERERERRRVQWRAMLSLAQAQSYDDQVSDGSVAVSLQRIFYTVLYASYYKGDRL